MPQQSPRIALPYLQASQAQKHVTHNEALQLLDAVTQLCLRGFAETTPPEVPVAGDTFGLGAAPVGAWAGQADQLAYWQGTGWLFFPPAEGWRAWGIAEQELRIWRNGAWQSLFDGLTQLSIGAGMDDTNTLSVAGASTLLSHAGAGHQLKINKDSSAETGSLLFQSNWTGHAEMGLAGSDAFAVKISADGQSWDTVLQADPVAQQISLAPAGTSRLVLGDSGLHLEVPVTGTAVQSDGEDGASGKLLKTGAQCLSDQNTSAMAPLDSLSGSWLSGYNGQSDGPVALTGAASDGYGVIVQGQRAAGRRHRIFQTLTGQLFHQTETGDGLQVPCRVFDTGNLLGPVSHSGGAPTGAVIERGSNANGDYVRFADGTQICWRRRSFTAQDLTEAYGSTFRSVNLMAGDTLLPINFVGGSSPSFHLTVSVQTTATGQIVGGIGDSDNFPDLVYATYHAALTNRTIYVNAMAIGRWF